MGRHMALWLQGTISWNYGKLTYFWKRDLRGICEDDFSCHFSFRFVGGTTTPLPVHQSFFWGITLKIMDLKHSSQTASVHLNRATLPEANIAPENEWLEYDRFLLEWHIFRAELLVSGRVTGSSNCFFCWGTHDIHMYTYYLHTNKYVYIYIHICITPSRGLRKDVENPNCVRFFLP